MREDVSEESSPRLFCQEGSDQWFKATVETQTGNLSFLIPHGNERPQCFRGHEKFSLWQTVLYSLSTKIEVLFWVIYLKIAFEYQQNDSLQTRREVVCGEALTIGRPGLCLFQPPPALLVTPGLLTTQYQGQKIQEDSTGNQDSFTDFIFSL